MKGPAQQRYYKKKGRDEKSDNANKERNYHYFDFIARAEFIFSDICPHKI